MTSRRAAGSCPAASLFVCDTVSGSHAPGADQMPQPRRLRPRAASPRTLAIPIAPQYRPGAQARPAHPRLSGGNACLVCCLACCLPSPPSRPLAPTPTPTIRSAGSSAIRPAAPPTSSRASSRRPSRRRSASRCWSTTSRVRATTSPPTSCSSRRPTATRCCSSIRRTRSTRRCTPSCRSTSWPTGRRSRASRGCPTSWRSTRRYRRRRSPSSSPTRRPIRARSTSPRRAAAPRFTCRASSSSRWLASTCCTCPTRARHRR